MTLTRRQVLVRGGAAGAALALPAWMRPAVAATHAPPRGVHLSYAQQPGTTTTATWFTDGALDPGTVVEWGPVHPGMRLRDIRYAPFEHAAAGASDATPGVDALTHRATMDGLSPGQAVRYRVGRKGAWSPPRTFSPGPAPGAKWRFAHFGDHGTNPASLDTTANVLRQKPDLVLLAGDLAYANGDQPIWDTWFGQIEPLAATRPLMAAPGNHENKDFGGDTFKKRLTQPGAGSYYGFDVGNVAFVVSTAGVFLEDGTIAQELAELDVMLAGAALRRATGAIDFIAVVQHYPLWTNHESRGPLNPSLVLAQEHILQRHQVDLVLAGHDHFYERSAPMAYGQVVDTPAGRTGYVQVVAGGGGQSLYEFVPPEAFQSWSVAHAKRYHAVVYDVDGPRITARVIATDRPGGEEIDRFTLDARPRPLLDPQPARSAAVIAADLGPLGAARAPAPRLFCPVD